MRRLKIGDRLLRVRDEGEGKKTPLVCIHGAGSSSVIWMDTVRRLSPKRRVVALDLPGHGQSDRWHPPAEVSIAMYRDAVGTVCANLKIEKAILVGHSMGGQIALDAALSWPERVAGVVMVNSGPKLAVSPRVFERLEKEFSSFPDWLAHVGWSPATPREIVERWQGIAFTADQEIATADFRAVERFDARPRLSSLRPPLLDLGGGDDLLAPPAPTARITPRSGHFLMLEQPEEFFAALDSFVATLA
jgi:pimeloyl-ACP methyl ester carboxylesterase